MTTIFVAFLIVQSLCAMTKVVLVLHSGWTQRSDARRLVELLNRRRIEVLGALIVDVPDHYLEQPRTQAPRPGSGHAKHEETLHGNPEALHNA